MNTKICTTIEQSKKLIELGIDVSTADMCWSLFNLIINGNKDINQILLPISYKRVTKQPAPDFIERFPAWSLSALLELMPKDESKTISLCLGGSNGMEHTFDWFCTCDENDEPFGYKTFHTSNPIDCTFEMICWLKEQELKGDISHDARK